MAQGLGRHISTTYQSIIYLCSGNPMNSQMYPHFDADVFRSFSIALETPI